MYSTYEKDFPELAEENEIINFIPISSIDQFATAIQTGQVGFEIYFELLL